MRREEKGLAMADLPDRVLHQRLRLQIQSLDSPSELPGAPPRSHPLHHLKIIIVIIKMKYGVTLPYLKME